MYDSIVLSQDGLTTGDSRSNCDKVKKIPHPKIGTARERVNVVTDRLRETCVFAKERQKV